MPSKRIHFSSGANCLLVLFCNIPSMVSFLKGSMTMNILKIVSRFQSTHIHHIGLRINTHATSSERFFVVPRAEGKKRRIDFFSLL